MASSVKTALQLRGESLEAEARALGLKVVAPAMPYSMMFEPVYAPSRAEKKALLLEQQKRDAISLKKRIAALRAQGKEEGFKVTITKPINK